MRALVREGNYEAHGRARSTSSNEGELERAPNGRHLVRAIWQWIILEVGERESTTELQSEVVSRMASAIASVRLEMSSSDVNQTVLVQAALLLVGCSRSIWPKRVGTSRGRPLFSRPVAVGLVRLIAIVTRGARTMSGHSELNRDQEQQQEQQ